MDCHPDGRAAGNAVQGLNGEVKEMRLKHEFEIMEVEDRSFAVPMEENNGFSGVVKLTRTAAEIFRLLREETTEEAIVEAMKKRYDVPEDVLTADVHRIIQRLRDKGMLT